MKPRTRNSGFRKADRPNLQNSQPYENSGVQRSAQETGRLSWIMNTSTVAPNSIRESSRRKMFPVSKRKPNLNRKLQ